MIEKTLRFNWLFDPLPPYADFVVDQWAKACPEWNVVFERTVPADVPAAIRVYLDDQRIPSPFRADLYRYWLMYAKGGVYVDLDTLPSKSLDGLLGDFQLFLSYTHFYGSSLMFVDNTIMGSIPGHTFWRDTIRRALTPAGWSKPRAWFCGTNSFPPGPIQGRCLLSGVMDEVSDDEKKAFIEDPSSVTPSPDYVFTHYRCSSALNIPGMSTESTNPTWLDLYGEYPSPPDVDLILA